MTFACLALLVSLQATAGVAPSAAQAPDTLTPEQTLRIRQLGDVRVSPDGSRVAFVVTEPPEGDERDRAIWMVDVATRHVRRLTYSDGSESSPRWSPDGRTLAFLSDRDEGRQLYLLPMDGGEAAPLTEGERSVGSFAWSPDGGSIAFVATAPRTEEEKKRIAEKDDARVVDKDDRHARAWTVDVATKKVRQLTKEPWSFGEVTWMPSGDALIGTATDRPASDEHTERIVRVSLGDSSVTVVASPKGPFGNVEVSPDGRRIAYIAARLDGPSPYDVYVQELGASEPRNLTAATLDRRMGAVRWQPDGTLTAGVTDGFAIRMVRLGLDGSVRSLVDAPVNPTTYSLRGGTLAFVGETTTRAPELWISVKGAQAERVTELNAGWGHPPLATPRMLTYKSFDGTPIEAALLMPSGQADGEKPPLVVLIHGGPTGRWGDHFEPWGQLLAARGYAVLYPNIRGSVGYGWAFLASNRGDWGGGDYRDVMAGVDTVIARGLVDPDRLGIGGWSYGGYMSEWAITQTHRFKAAVVGAGLSDLASEFGTEAGPAYDEWFWGLPYENLDAFIQHSPVTFAKNIRTPTLILQGTEDTTDPQGQSDQLYRPLKRYGVPVEYVLYPREPHGLREEKHLLDRLNRVIAWYDEYVKGG